MARPLTRVFCILACWPGRLCVIAGARCTDLPLSGMRKVIAGRLTESKRGTPHAYAEAEAELDGVLALRAQLKRANVEEIEWDFRADGAYEAAMAEHA